VAFNLSLPYASRQAIRCWPGVLALQLKVLRPASATQLATRSSTLCLEGFPRSGNGFSYACVRDVVGVPQPAIAHHTHSPANILRAVRLGLPTYVLVRSPDDCCPSLVIWGASRALDDALSAYQAFHEALLPVLDQVTVVPFEQLTAAPETFVRQVADDLGRPQPRWDADVAASVRRTIERSDEARQVTGFVRASLPTEEKARLKAELAERAASPQVSALTTRCRTLREQILRTAPRVLGR